MPEAALSLEQLALNFRDQFPIDAEFTTKEFDKWGMSRAAGGHRIRRLSGAYSPRNPEWGGLLINRHVLKQKINKGARRLDNEHQFQICVEGANHWRTYQMIEAASNGSRSLSTRVKKVVSTKFINIKRLMDAPEYDGLSQETRMLFKHFEAQQRDSLSLMDHCCSMMEQNADGALATAKAELMSRRDRRVLGQLQFLFNEEELQQFQRRPMARLQSR